jgi:hypothetical protein
VGREVAVFSKINKVAVANVNLVFTFAPEIYVEKFETIATTEKNAKAVTFLLSFPQILNKEYRQKD